jgi:hypothetical protein
MRTSFRFASLLVLSCLASCVSTKNVPLSQADGARLKGSNVATTARKTPPFGAMTAGKVAAGSLFGAVGGAIAGTSMVSEGDKIVASNNIQDPAHQISRELVTALSQARGIKVVTPAANITKEDPKAVAAAAGSADFVLDVRTVNWSFVYFPANWARYRVIYSVQLRLIETKTGKVIAEGFHARIPEKTSNSPDYDGLLANGAEVIKTELRTAAAESVAHFKKNVLGL